MMAGLNDDFEELRELLFRARERYKSARATVLDTVYADVAEKANRSYVDWRFAQMGGFGMEREGGGEWRRRPREDFYRAYEHSERAGRLRHERPDHWREEWHTPDGSMLRCVVFGGARGPRWVYEPPGTAVYHPPGVEEWSRQDPYTALSFMLDPSEDLSSHTPLSMTRLFTKRVIPNPDVYFQA